MRMCCACIGVHVISQYCCRQDKETRSVAPFLLVCLLFFGFSHFVSFCLLMRGHRGRRHGSLAVSPAGVPAAASTIFAVSGLAGASPRGRSGCPSSSGSLPPLLTLWWPSLFLGMIFWPWYGMSSHG